VPTWLELWRFIEGQQDWQRALQEHHELTETSSQERASVAAFMTAGRIRLNRFSQPEGQAPLYLGTEVTGAGRRMGRIDSQLVP